MADEPITEPLDLRQFLDAVKAATDDESGFDLDDILAVEEAWEQDDDEVVMNGHIVALRSGDRLYVEYKAVREDDDVEAELTITPLESGMERPDLGDSKQGIYWYRPDHITTHLYSLRLGAGREDTDS